MSVAGFFSSEEDFRHQTEGVRKAIWLYIILWLVEGAFRKWLLPGLSSYILFIREPVVIVIYCMAVSRGVFAVNGFIVVLGILSFLGLVASLLHSDVNIVVVFYGVRSYFLHYPLIFVIGRVMNRRDVEKVGLLLLCTAVPMALLMMMQFLAPEGSTWNNGAGGLAGGQMIGALGHARPSGTFSFANGGPLYLALLAAFIVYGFTRTDLYPKWLLWGALFSLLLGMVVSVSRNTVVSVILVIVAFVLMGIFYPRYFRKFIGLGVGILVFGALLSMLPVFSSGIDSLQSRFQDGGDLSSSIGGRFVGAILNPWNDFLNIDMFGIGMGRATNAALLYTKNDSMIIEDEWMRTLWELGWILGSAFLAMRVAIALWLLRRAHLELLKGGALAGLILASCFVNLFMTPLGLTTGQGFIMIAAGLCLASENVADAEAADPAAAEPSRRPRGRSLYAERLHGGPGSQISGTGPGSGA